MGVMARQTRGPIYKRAAMQGSVTASRTTVHTRRLSQETANRHPRGHSRAHLTLLARLHRQKPVGELRGRVAMAIRYDFSPPSEPIDLRTDFESFFWIYPEPKLRFNGVNKSTETSEKLKFSFASNSQYLRKILTVRGLFVNFLILSSC